MPPETAPLSGEPASRPALHLAPYKQEVGGSIPSPPNRKPLLDGGFCFLRGKHYRRVGVQWRAGKRGTLTCRGDLFSGNCSGTGAYAIQERWRSPAGACALGGDRLA